MSGPPSLLLLARVDARVKPQLLPTRPWVACLASDAWPSCPICPIWAAGWILGFFFTPKCRTALVQPGANLLASRRLARQLASHANGASATSVIAAMTRGLWAKCLDPLKNSFRIKAVVAFPWKCTLETSTAGKSSS
jgi:hypothetical protein